ncbi:MAG: hypothetical protein KIT68_01925 [Phycisphaeraceae bacterium]|nr:hypothetical protein [Phycisphaeraceae bacterium]
MDPSKWEAKFVMVGLCDGLRETTDKATGAVAWAGNVSWVGGSFFFRLEDPAVGRLCRKGSVIKVEAPARSFKGQLTPGFTGVKVVELDGKPLSAAPTKAA